MSIKNILFVWALVCAIAFTACKKGAATSDPTPSTPTVTHYFMAYNGNPYSSTVTSSRTYILLRQKIANNKNIVCYPIYINPSSVTIFSDKGDIWYDQASRQDSIVFGSGTKVNIPEFCSQVNTVIDNNKYAVLTYYNATTGNTATKTYDLPLSLPGFGFP